MGKKKKFNKSVKRIQDTLNIKSAFLQGITPQLQCKLSYQTWTFECKSRYDFKALNSD